MGTSVLKKEDFEKTVEMASKMKSHFSSLKIEKILIGGEKSDLVNEIEEKLSAKIDFLKTGYKGMNEEQENNYLIPLSMLSEDFKEPSDPNTINLLPSFLVEKYTREKARIGVWSITLTITLFVWVSFLVVMTSYFVINQKISDLKTYNLGKTDVVSLRQKYVSQAKDINSLVEKINKIKNLYVIPQEVLNSIHKAKPTGIYIDTYQVDLDSGDIHLSGVSSDRGALISFKDGLEKNGFTGVNIPISSFEKGNEPELSDKF